MIATFASWCINVGEFEFQETLLSIDKAKKMLGYAPQFSWRDHIAGN
jgi:hypothetical protein